MGERLNLRLSRPWSRFIRALTQGGVVGDEKVCADTYGEETFYLTGEVGFCRMQSPWLFVPMWPLFS